jgi:hypothetical protein
MRDTLLFVGAILNGALAVFHLTFWANPGFDWSQELPKLNPLNRATMQVATLMFVYVLAAFAVTSFLLRSAPSFGAAERAIAILIGGFHLVRAMPQFPFFGVSRISAALFAVCLLASACYLGALL